MFLIFLGLCILIFIIEVPRLIRQKYFKEFYVFATLLLIGLFMGLAYYYFEWLFSAPFDAMISYFGG